MNAYPYIKTSDYRSLQASDPCLEGLASFYLDILAVQKEHPRSAPNSWIA